jgi:hypothetical protein
VLSGGGGAAGNRGEMWRPTPKHQPNFCSVIFGEEAVVSTIAPALAEGRRVMPF